MPCGSTSWTSVNTLVGPKPKIVVVVLPKVALLVRRPLKLKRTGQGPPHLDHPTSATRLFRPHLLLHHRIRSQSLHMCELSGSTRLSKWISSLWKLPFCDMLRSLTQLWTLSFAPCIDWNTLRTFVCLFVVLGFYYGVYKLYHSFQSSNGCAIIVTGFAGRLRIRRHCPVTSLISKLAPVNPIFLSRHRISTWTFPGSLGTRFTYGDYQGLLLEVKVSESDIAIGTVQIITIMI